MAIRVVVLGAGFGGLELAAQLSAELGEQLDLVLIDQNDSFFFGYSKLDVMFGRKLADAVRLPYRAIAKPGVRFVQETVTAIDPAARRVRTHGGTYEADVLVVALGARYDLEATPGLAEGGGEFYSFAGAVQLGERLRTFAAGDAVIGICGVPFKCPPAPSETAMLLHDYLTARGVRDKCRISLVMPFPVPVPPSPETSAALLAAFAERGITFIPNRLVTGVDAARGVLRLDDGSELPCDLFLGVPRHCVPDVVAASGLAENGWIPVDPRTLKTRFPGVYAVGDVANMGTAKAGDFAEGAARVVAAQIVASVRGGEAPPFLGTGRCYVEFGLGNVGRVDVDFFSGPTPVGTLMEPSAAMAADKESSGAERTARWFGS